MRPEDYYRFWGGSDFHKEHVFHDPWTNHQAPHYDPPPAKSVDSYPQIQEGDHGMFILYQVSLDWRQKALVAIQDQVLQRQEELHCRMIINVSNLADGGLLVEWKRMSCVEVPGGPK